MRLILGKLSKKAPLIWLISSAFDWAVIVVTIVCCNYFGSVALYLISIFILGNRQHALALLGHDGTHRTIHKNPKLNDTVSDFLAFWPIGLTTTGYRFVHFKHHSHLNTEHDPELMHRSTKAPQWDLPITLRKIFRYALYDLIGYSISDYLMIVRFAKPNSKFEYIPLVSMHLLFIAISLYLNALWIPALWYASLLTTFMMFFRLRTWMEHQGSEGTHRIKLNWLEGLIFAPHNSWHHYEHHSFPTVPFFRLGKLRSILGEEGIVSLSELARQYTVSKRIRSGTALKTSKI